MTSYVAFPQLMTSPTWLVGERVMTFDKHRVIMGILNVTPDSFSDGGDYYDQEAAVAHGVKMVNEGAGIVDVGGESTRPGAEPVSLEEELRRVVPVIQRLATTLPTSTIISVDTTKADVAEAALEAGAHIVNDVSGLGFDPRMVEVVSKHKASLVLMHIRGTPETMEDLAKSGHHKDVIQEEVTYFRSRLSAAQHAGIDLQRVAIDPGIGFGKTTAENFTLLRELGTLVGTLGRPVVLGTSRKRLISDALEGRDTDHRDWGTAATVACGVLLGAHVFRVHDVASMYDVITVTDAICAGSDVTECTT